MSQRDNGGWAFPQPTFQHPNGDTYGAGDWDSRNGGMSLRDWFAGQALAGLLGGEPGSHLRPDRCAHAAYEYADAMLAERSK